MQEDTWRQTSEAALGEPPEDWAKWTNAAEEGLLTSLRITRQGGHLQRGATRYKRQALSRPLDGKYGKGRWVLAPQ